MIPTRGLGSTNLVVRGFGSFRKAVRFFIKLTTEHATTAVVEESASIRQISLLTRAVADTFQATSRLVSAEASAASLSTTGLDETSSFTQVVEESDYAVSSEVSDETLPDVTTTEVTPSVASTQIGTREE